MTVNGVQTNIVYSLSHDPWHNLALEELMLRNLQDDVVILYLWQNQNTVVIGRNQNAWKECKCEQLESDGGKLARRLSGGGAVFHDLGNLNFTFITNKKHYDLQKQLSVILEGVRNLGINGEFSGRNDLVVQGRKFSGNAFYFDSDRALHHGTVLVDTDFSKLTNYLQVSSEKINSKGIDSVRARVVNLTELDNAITVDKVRTSVRQSFETIYGEPVQELSDYELRSAETHRDLYNRYASWDWRFGHTPQFTVSHANRFPWGGVDVALSLQDGTISNCMIYSDAMDANLINEVALALNGVPYTTDNMVNAINTLANSSDEPNRRQVIYDLTQWLLSK